jgi:hypothetical protein
MDSHVVDLRPTLTFGSWLKVSKVAAHLGTGCFLTDLDMSKSAFGLPAAALPLREVTDNAKLGKVSTSGWM